MYTDPYPERSLGTILNRMSTTLSGRTLIHAQYFEYASCHAACLLQVTKEVAYGVVPAACLVRGYKVVTVIRLFPEVFYPKLS